MKFKSLIFLVLFTFTASGAFADSSQKISVMCSLFPVYDFAREVAGDCAEVKLLLRPGVEPHEFEPSPMDIKALNDSQVFIFTGVQMEHWAEKISSSLTHTKIIDSSRNIELVNNDPHIWLDLNRAQKMVENIRDGLCMIDPSHVAAYELNAKNFCEKLAKMDTLFFTMPKNKTLIFAGEFAAGYFMRRYGFDYVSAYDGENEPSVRRMAEILRVIDESHARCIFSPPVVSSITRSISEQTGTEILTFDSAEIAGTDKSFLSIMQGNYEALKAALND